MNSELSVPKCPQCGAAIPADAPQGLCPRCVLLGAATTTDAGKPVPRSEPPAPDALRAAFPQLEIIELIGRGGMGFVYKARQAKLDRTVALKLLPVELGADPHFAERFHREARALARLNHPGIVAVYDFGVSAGFCYLLLEFVDGVNLRQAMQAGRFSPAAALAVVPKICEALQFAHERGVLHRDIKPENLLLDAQGRVKIADFGIAKLVGEDTPDLTLTLSGARLGTPTYMAPEQIEHPGTVDHRADIYSLGVVFYELLTGELPLGRFAPPSAKADLDARVDDIVMRALAKERELRQQSVDEVKTEVETVAKASVNSNAVAVSGQVTSVPTVPRRRFTALKVAGWAIVWLLILFLTPSLIPALRRTAGTPDDAFWVGRLFYLSLGALAGLWMLSGCWVFRAEQRRHGAAAAWPGWGRWVALLLLVCTVLSVGRSWATLWANAGREVAVLVVPGEMGILATSLALLLRRHDLRLVATSGLAVHGALTMAGFWVWQIWRLRGGAESMPSIEPVVGLSTGGLIACSALLVVLGFAALWQREMAGMDLGRTLRRWLKPIGATALVLVAVLTAFLAIRRPRSQAQFNQWLGIEVVSRMELQLPRGQATAIQTTAWINGVPTPLPGAGLSLSPGLLGEATVLQWRLRRLNAPGEWELVVTGEDDQKLLGPVAVNLGTNVTALQPPANARLAPTVGTFNRWWPFLPSFVKGNGVTSPDSSFGWGISVDVGPETVLSPAKRIDVRPPAKLNLQGLQTLDASLQIWSNRVPIPTGIMMSSVRELGERGDARVGLEFWLEREPHTNRLRLSCKREDGRSAVSIPVPIPAELALLALSNAPPHGLLTNGHLRHWLFLPTDAAATVVKQDAVPETALWGVSLDVRAPEPQLEPVADSRARLLQLEREVRPRMMKAIAEAALKELKQRGGEGGEALGLDIQAAEKLLAEADAELRRIEANTPKP